jgi:hypothetical protein
VQELRAESERGGSLLLRALTAVHASRVHEAGGDAPPLPTADHLDVVTSAEDVRVRACVRVFVSVCVCVRSRALVCVHVC